ncbi:hypothetical protein NSERUTF1_4862 [Nocardia seriolae]|nr:hypothetical protein NSERUTF1_4862 [Nocardia seriolae]
MTRDPYALRPVHPPTILDAGIAVPHPNQLTGKDLRVPIR